MGLFLKCPRWRVEAHRPACEIRRLSSRQSQETEAMLRRPNRAQRRHSRAPRRPHSTASRSNLQFVWKSQRGRSLQSATFTVTRTDYGVAYGGVMAFPFVSATLAMPPGVTVTATSQRNRASPTFAAISRFVSQYFPG